MIESMTGYGAARAEAEGLRVHAELKSLNSRYFEVTCRLPQHYLEQEVLLKQLLQDKLRRGKVTLALTLTYTNGEAAELGEVLDEALLKAYYTQLENVRSQLGLQQPIALEQLTALPHVVREDAGQAVTDDEWALVERVVHDAIKALQQNRQVEGARLKPAFEDNLAAIERLSAEIKPYEEQRRQLVREKLEGALEQLKSVQANAERFEQELIYYLEKLDITEEQVRLQAHLALFRETMASAESQGRKLNFVAQEMGREINTLGAKANMPEIQALVVDMKDELEKIKEQVNNIL